MKLVDAEAIANDKMRTHDLTNQLQSQNLDTQQSEQLMFTHSRVPKNKHKPAYKKLALIVIEQITPSQLVSKNIEIMKTKETHKLDIILHNSHMYDTFAPLRVKITLTEQRILQIPLIDTAVEVHYVIVIQIETFHHNLDIVLILEIVTDMTELLLPHNITDQDMTIIDNFFGVADIKNNILGTPFLGEIMKNIRIQDFTFQFEHQPKDEPNFIQYTFLLSKEYPYFSYNYRINSRTQIRFNPNSSKTAHFPIKYVHNLHFATTLKIKFFPTIPHTCFAPKLRTTFKFIEVFNDDKPNISSTIFQNSTSKRTHWLH